MDIVRESIKCVVQNSKQVSINYKSLDCFVDSFKKNSLEHWFKASPFDIFSLTLKERIAYAFVLDSISFSYWGNPKWTIEHGGNKYEGTKAMMLCIGKAIKNGVPLLEPKYLSTIDEKTLESVLEGNVRIPLFDERMRILQELGKEATKYGGYEKIIDSVRIDAFELAKKIIRIFPSFEDSANYYGRKIFFYKRAQLLAADITHFMEGTREIYHLKKLTACADYIEPQVFTKLGIFRYSENLAGMIADKAELDPCSNEVTEIRANNIFVIDLIADRVGVAANKINNYIWLLGQNEYYYDEPHLRARTTAF